ncbi:O-methylpimelyl-ACP methylesterase [Desulfuromonas versatilis]|uniref:O-methylpimelyl-ACP methylesterase n=1 Tax=Desulfuromonas versatilis TaxID=2802975 RepID=A0ABN6E3J6_9BACT|nr:alpha/beta fold hydrolase [Desulfuromonas versatilis]BCR05741.1 O-methylpimelyl-ACP methylesterase [Desulfuromonas versatilis]
MQSFCLADGRRLAYREAGAGRPLVLLHGWSMSSVVFSEALEAFSGEFRVLAPDLRGHGASDPGPGYGFAELGGDLAQWFAGLDLENAAVLGWSMGGQVLLELYPRLRARIERILLVGSTPCFTASAAWPHGLPAGQVRAMARNLQRAYLKTMGDFFALQFAGEEIARQRYRRIVEFAVRAGRLPDPDVALAALEALGGADQRGDLGAVDCPALVVHGELDRITPAGAGRYLAEQLPQGRLALLPETGHGPFLSRPEATFALWREFLG